MSKNNNNETDTEVLVAEISENVDDKELSNSEVSELAQQVYDALSFRPYHTKLNPPTSKPFKSNKPSMLQENPYAAKSPQEIMKLYGDHFKDESMFPNNPAVPNYIDSFEIGDFQHQLDTVNNVIRQFNALPSEIRSKYNNDFREFGLAISSPDFNIEDIMTQKFKDEVYYPKKRRDEKALRYQEYLKQKQEEEMKDFKPAE